MELNYKAFLKKIEIPKHFYNYYDIFDYIGVEEGVKALNPALDNFNFWSGATKLVVEIENLDFVFKIPFNGCCRDQEYEIREECCEEDEGITYIPFSHCTNDFNNWDYCERECFLYEELNDNPEIQQFFVKTSYVGVTSKDYPVYKQEKIPFIGEDYISNSNVDKKLLEKTKKDNHTPFPSIWLALAYQHYGEKAVNNLLNFCKKNPSYCADLRDDNLGIRANGAPVIVDYAGYEEG